MKYEWKAASLYIRSLNDRLWALNTRVLVGVLFVLRETYIGAGPSAPHNDFYFFFTHPCPASHNSARMLVLVFLILRHLHHDGDDWLRGKVTSLSGLVDLIYPPSPSIVNQR